MRKIIKIFLLLFISKIYCQDKTIDEYKRCIDSAIVIKANNLNNIYISELNKNLQTDNWKIYINNLRNNIANIYLVDNNYKAINLDGVISQIPLKTIDVYDKKNTKIIKRGIYVWKIIPKMKGNILSINIIDFNLSFKNKNYFFVNGGNSSIEFEYLCNQKMWVLRN